MAGRQFPIVSCVVITVICLAFGGGASLAAAWDEVSSLPCGSLYDAAGSPWGPKTAAMFTWLTGFRDGIGALSPLDKRLAEIGRFNFEQLGAAVLAYCKAQPQQTVAQAATATMEMLINAQSGRKLALTKPN